LIRFLLDTDICIFLIKNQPREVPEKFRQHPPTETAISVITLFELEYGAEKSGPQLQSISGRSPQTWPLSPPTRHAGFKMRGMQKEALAL